MTRIPTFWKYREMVNEETGQSQREYKDYLSGKKPLGRAMLSHPDGDSIYDYVHGNMKRDMWMHKPKDLRNMVGNLGARDKKKI